MALDSTLWDEPTTGITRYAREVAGALARRGVRVLRVGARRSGEIPRRVRSRALHTLAELPRVLPRSGASLFHAVGNVDLPLLRVPGVPFVLTVHDQHRPAAFGEQGAESFGQVFVAANAQDEHLPRQFAELSGQLVGHIAEAQLGSHFEAVHGLRL